MKKGITPIVIGNWKMNPQSASLAIRLGKELKKELFRVRDREVVIAPPSLYVGELAKIKNGGSTFSLGAQNVHHEKLGSYTGEVSLSMLRDYGVTHVILGHSERRREGETDEMIHKKLTATIKAGLTGIVCVGELQRDQGGQYLSFIEMEVRKALSGIQKVKLPQIIIAYEPIWAIGTGETATSADVHEMRLFIEKVVADLYGRNYAEKVRVIYGGSVNGKNAEELFREGTVDGFLVGGASLHAKEFVEIVKSVTRAV